MRSSLKHVAALLLLVMFLLSATSCSNTMPPPSDSVAPDNTPSAATDTPTSIVAPVDWPTLIDPGVGSKGSDSTAIANLYDSLTFPNSDSSISPLVAKDWDVSEDGTVYTFSLRDDVVFHSGNKLTADDVKFSMDRMLTMGEGYGYLFAGSVTDTEVVDEYTVRFTLAEPSGLFPNMLIRLYILDEKLVMENIDPSGTYGEYGDYGKEWLLTHDAGSGPYQVQEMRTEEYLIMEKNTEYWLGWEGKEASPDTVKLLGGVDTTNMRTMLSRGEIDFSDDAQTMEAYETLDAMGGIDLVRAPMGVNFNCCLNTKIAPTDDIHVRKAMAFAMDYDTIINDIYAGSIKATGPIPVGMTGSLTQEESPYYLDIEAATAELEQSPYYDQLISGEMHISLTYCSEGGAQQENLALLTQANMAAIGITVDITSKPFAAMMTDATTVESTPNASFVAFAPSYLDGSGYLRNRYCAETCGTWEQMEWLQDDEINQMIQTALTEPDQAKREAMYKEISMELVEMCPTIWMADLATTIAVRSSHVMTPMLEMYQAGESFVYSVGYGGYYRDFTIVE